MNHKLWILPVLLGAVATAQPVFADEPEEDWLPGTVAGSAAFTTDYTFRGISQTSEGAAAQASLEYSLETGIENSSAYLGIWGSNVDFDDGGRADVELDISFGFRGEILDTGVTWDVGGLYYYYPGANDNADGDNLNYNYWEIPVKLGYAINDIVAVGAQYNYSPDYFGASGNAHWLAGNVAVTPPVPYVGLAFTGSVGQQWIEHNAVYGADDWLTWSIGAAVTVKGVQFSVAYIDTNLSESDCFGGRDWCSARVVGTVSYAF